MVKKGHMKYFNRETFVAICSSLCWEQIVDKIDDTNTLACEW